MAGVAAGISAEEAGMVSSGLLSAEEFRATAARIEGEVARRLVGQQTVLRHVMICLIAGGHAPLQGGAGLGKNMVGAPLGDRPGPPLQRGAVPARPLAGEHPRTERPAPTAG